MEKEKIHQNFTRGENEFKGHRFLAPAPHRGFPLRIPVPGDPGARSMEQLPFPGILLK
jgi:hypothetical protein